MDAVFVSEMWIAGDLSAPRGLSYVPWVRRGRGSQREARAAAWEAVCEKGRILTEPGVQQAFYVDPVVLVDGLVNQAKW